MGKAALFWLQRILLNLLPLIDAFSANSSAPGHRIHLSNKYD